jgi:CRP-like cAMP-binding protein
MKPYLKTLTWFTEVKKLHNGDSFGELALVNEAPRAATITAVETSAFAVIDKEAYMKVLLKIEQKAKHKIDAFLSSVPIFKPCNRKQLLNLHLLFEQRQFGYN